MLWLWVLSVQRKYDLNQRLTPTCPFCRETLPNSNEDHYQNVKNKKRAADGSPDAICELGMCERRLGDIAGALDYWHKAAELGSVEAHYELSKAYHYHGRMHGCDNNIEKFQYHAEQAAMGGHHLARFNLGCNEMLNRNQDRAVRHWTIAARQGSEAALRALKKSPFASKEEYNAAKRAQQEAMKEMESDQRNKAEEARRRQQEPPADSNNRKERPSTVWERLMTGDFFHPDLGPGWSITTEENRKDRELYHHYISPNNKMFTRLEKAIKYSALLSAAK